MKQVINDNDTQNHHKVINQATAITWQVTWPLAWQRRYNKLHRHNSIWVDFKGYFIWAWPN
jgi:hypothetical protein